MHVLATFTSHHDPDPLQGEQESDAADAASLALDAALNDQPLPDIAEPAPASSTPSEPAAPAADPFDEAIGGGDPAGVTPEARAAADLATKQEADRKAAEAAAGTPDLDAEAKAKVDADIDNLRAELKAEGKELSPKGEARFRTMAGTINQQAAQLETVAKSLGLDLSKPEEVQQRLALVADNAQAGVDMVQLVQKTGATAEQYGMTLDYLAASNAANAGDTKAQETVWGWLVEELTHYAGMLGREIPGLVDPLKGHPDLQADVDNLDITRARALELAAGRNRVAREEANRTAQTQQQQTQQQQGNTQTQAIAAGRTALNDLGAQLSAADPAGFKAKAPALAAIVKDVAAKFPPDQWTTQVAIAYAKLQAPAPVAPAAPVGGPLRSTGPVGVLETDIDDPFVAMEAGISAADRGG